MRISSSQWTHEIVSRGRRLGLSVNLSAGGIDERSEARQYRRHIGQFACSTGRTERPVYLDAGLYDAAVEEGGHE